ncbi:short-chain dehydrogenase/reductase SDR [Weissella oryzae SG25]|uniref:Short-chain dehydrogenase/reductase SDR n=1 Tax=Weissella oryzae (strain DSM 25784 / JCM 18191 / LMG 30913 / SG25) TaxID=1329250 RepID=A0A069CVS5_WEIOS|nr:hypothetical protein [Weissella oryzae]GAK31890.1 short-chain dehydrogenase/reductase SDR [Weissella oryzae SG25]
MKMNGLKRVIGWLNRYDILINTLLMWVCVAFIGNSEAKWMRMFAVIAVFVYSLILALMDTINSHIIELQSELIETKKRRVSQLQKLVETQEKLIYKYKSLNNLNGGDNESTQS